jgi:hypothetical protein
MKNRQAPTCLLEEQQPTRPKVSAAFLFVMHIFVLIISVAVLQIKKEEQENMSNFFTSNDMDSLVFFQVPKVLILSERYKSMKPNALKLYIVLLDRMKLSLMNGWKDIDGKYYVRMSQDRAAELFQWSPTTFRSMKRELELYDLLEQDREGQGKSNRLYIKKCEYDEKDVYKINKVVDLEFEEEEKKAQDIDKSQKNNFCSSAGNIEKDKSCSSAENIEKNKSCSSRKTTVGLLEGQQLTTNNNNIKDNKNNKNDLFVNKQVVNKDKNEIINSLVLEYMKKGMSKELCFRVLSEVEENKSVTNFGGYFRTCLENTLYKSQVKHGIIDPTEKWNKTEIPYYDWLNN